MPPRGSVHPLRHIRWPLSESPISQSKDRLLCVPGPSEKTPPKLTESSGPNPPLQTLFKQSTELCGLVRKKSIGRKFYTATRQLDQQVTRSHTPGPWLFTPPKEQPFRGEHSLIGMTPSLIRHTILLQSL